MRLIVFGATGMVGQGVLRECVLDPEVEAVLAVMRRPSGPALGRRSEKMREVVTNNFYDYGQIESQFAGYDACLFCLGVSAVGMKEAEYRRVTYDLTLAAARAVLRANPRGMTFEYVSGVGTNAKGRQMWARVKGETENSLLEMGFAHAYMLRPGWIVPMHGIQSRTSWYRGLYAAMRPVLPLMLRWFPNHVTTTERLGRTMLQMAKHGSTKQVIEAADLARMGEL